MKKVLNDLKLGFSLAFRARTIKEDAIFYLIALGLSFAMLTGSAIAKNTFDNAGLIELGVMAYVIGCMGIFSDYNAVLFSDFLLASPRAKELQIKILLEMSMALCLVGFTLMALVELLFARDCSGDVLFHLSLFFAAFMILNGGSRKNYVRTVVIMVIPLLMFVSGGTVYFTSGFAIKEFHMKDFLLLESWPLAFFRAKPWRALATGYLVLIVAGLLQYLELRYWWKKDGSKLYYTLKRNVV